MRHSLVFLLVIAVGIALLPGIAVADTRVGGTVTVDGQHSGDVSATGGTVVVTGTIDGDLRVYGGDVRIAEEAEVTGIVRAYGGDVIIDGTVGGNALAYGGNVTLGESGSVDRSFGAVAGDVTVAGNVGGDVNVFAGQITIAETAVVEGGLTYQGELVDEGGTVEGITQQASDLALVPPVGPLLAIFGVMMFFGDLLLGAVLIYLVPDFADAAALTVQGEPLRTVGTGLVAVVGTALAIGLLAITLVGLPLAVALLLLAIIFAWVAAVYGRYTIGAYVLSYTSYDSRYLALVVGIVLVTAVGFLPYIGPFIRAIVFLLGVGVIAYGIVRVYELASRDRRGLSKI